MGIGLPARADAVIEDDLGTPNWLLGLHNYRKDVAVVVAAAVGVVAVVAALLQLLLLLLLRWQQQL